VIRHISSARILAISTSRIIPRGTRNVSACVKTIISTAMRMRNPAIPIADNRACIKALCSFKQGFLILFSTDLSFKSYLQIPKEYPYAEIYKLKTVPKISGPGRYDRRAVSGEFDKPDAGGFDLVLFRLRPALFGVYRHLRRIIRGQPV
jgi:hypothetical protein